MLGPLSRLGDIARRRVMLGPAEMLAGFYEQVRDSFEAFDRALFLAF